MSYEKDKLLRDMGKDPVTRKDAEMLRAEEVHECPICLVPFEPADLCATDIELGICHAACLEGSPTVDLNTGEPVDGPISTYRYDDAGRP